MQDRESRSINSSDTSITKSTQLDYAIPASKIASLSSGEFVGIVADDPDCKIKLKVFHSEIQNDHEAIKKEEDLYKPIPLIKNVSATDIKENYNNIKWEILQLLADELKKIDTKQPDQKVEPNETSEINNSLSM